MRKEVGKSGKMMLVTVEFSLRPGVEAQFEAALDKAHTCLAKYEGFLGEQPCKSIVDDNQFVTLFYFRDRESIEVWRRDADHIEMQRLGKEKIFSWYRIRIAEVEHEYGINEPEGFGLRTR